MYIFLEFNLFQNKDIIMVCGFGEDWNYWLEFDLDLYSLSYGYRYFKFSNVLII